MIYGTRSEPEAGLSLCIITLEGGPPLSWASGAVTGLFDTPGAEGIEEIAIIPCA